MEFFTVSEIAKKWEIPESTVCKLASEEYFRAGRFLDNFISMSERFKGLAFISKDDLLRLISSEKISISDFINTKGEHFSLISRLEAELIKVAPHVTDLALARDITDEEISTSIEINRSELLVIAEEFSKFIIDNSNLIALKQGQYEEDESKSRTKGGIITPDGTEWHDITIRFIDLHKVSIAFGKHDKGKRYIERNFKSFDFSFNKKKKDPTKQWLHLFSLALHQGDPPKPRRKGENGTTTKDVSLIRSSLKAIFPGVVGEPIGNYERGKGWPLKINLCVSKSLSEKYRGQN